MADFTNTGDIGSYGDEDIKFLRVNKKIFTIGKKGYGSVGSPSGDIAKLYGARVRSDGGIVESLNCVIAALDKLYFA